MIIHSAPPELHRAEKRGFALIITVSLMVLLAVICVGILTLSSISLRSSSQGEAQAIAKANARLALMLAIGDLQKYAGPDQRITATGSIMGDADASSSVAMPNIAGVWQSWQIDANSPPSASDYQKTVGKSSKFLSWLVSTPSASGAESQDFVKSALPANDRVSLMPAVSVGTTTYPELYAGVVSVNGDASSRGGGGFGWAVLDEGTKARIDTGYREPTSSKLGDQSMVLGCGKRADASRVQELEAFTWERSELDQADYDLDSGISLGTVGLLDKKYTGNLNDKIKGLEHDVTVNSVGLFTDVANGGLKQDLNSILNGDSLPSDLSSRGIYQTQLGYAVTADADIGYADPQWSPLHRFSTLYQDVFSAGSVPYVSASGPSGWDVDDALDPPPAAVDPVLMPAVSKVQIFYSLVACPLKKGNNSDSDSWVFANNKVFSEPWNNGARYMIYLIYTPVVTLHNPYNVTLSIPKLSVEFNNVPMSIQISRNGGAYYPSIPGAVQSLYQGAYKLKYMKSFKFTLKNSSGSDTALRIQPGELVAFSPDIPTSASFQSERDLARADRTFLDTQDSSAISGGAVADALDTSKQYAQRGFRGIAAGYALDFTNFGTGTYTDPPYKTSGNSAYRFSGANDNFRVKFRPTSDARVSDSEEGVFSVVMSDGNSSSYTALNFDFAGPTDGNLVTGLEKALGLDSDGQIYPAPDEPALTIGQIAVPTASTSIIDFPSNAFAIVTATAKTTLANQDGSNYEGRYATKPWSFTAPVGNFLRQRIEENGSVHQAQYPFELDVVALSPSTGYGGDDYVNADALGRGNGITGHTSTVGKQFGTAYEIPLAPLQALPQLNSANLAGGNSLSRFLYPIGNSWAHPMIATSQISGSAPLDDLAGQYDHSFLLNLSLYDSFYFSGIAPSNGSKFMDSVTTDELAEDFFSSDRDKTMDDRLTAYLPAGKTVSDATGVLADASTARKQAAAYQVMKGAFNVNSTSKEAWKAMLASIFAGGSQMNEVDTTMTTGLSTVGTLEPAAADHVRFSRFRVPNAEACDPSSSSADESQNFFLGPRDITEDQLDTLAEEIVKQVKTRGPFLSMAEFVNRQLGASSALTLKGALQAAIDESRINTDTSALPVLSETGYEISASQVADYGFASPDAAIGRSDQGAPGSLSQSDLLVALGNAATVRSDTFRIRCYGEARDGTGLVTSRAWCEAVVQRTPDFVSAENPPETALADAGMATVNKTFGRSFVVTSFRWLNSADVE